MAPHRPCPRPLILSTCLYKDMRSCIDHLHANGSRCHIHVAPPASSSEPALTTFMRTVPDDVVAPFTALTRPNWPDDPFSSRLATPVPHNDSLGNSTRCKYAPSGRDPIYRVHPPAPFMGEGSHRNIHHEWFNHIHHVRHSLNPPLKRS